MSLSGMEDGNGVVQLQQPSYAEGSLPRTKYRKKKKIIYFVCARLTCSGANPVLTICMMIGPLPRPSTHCVASRRPTHLQAAAACLTLATNDRPDQQAVQPRTSAIWWPDRYSRRWHCSNARYRGQHASGNGAGGSVSQDRTDGRSLFDMQLPQPKVIDWPGPCAWSSLCVPVACKVGWTA